MTKPCLAVLLLMASAPVLAQDDGENDIVVTGKSVTIAAGLWQFVRTPTITFAHQNGQARTPAQMAPGYRWQSCIIDASLQDSVMRLLSEPPERPTEIGCTKMRLRIDGDKLSGSKSCSKFGMSSHSRLSGKLSATSMVVTGNVTREGRNDYASESRWRLTARRVGDCAAR